MGKEIGLEGLLKETGSKELHLKVAEKNLLKLVIAKKVKIHLHTSSGKIILKE